MDKRSTIKRAVLSANGPLPVGAVDRLRRDAEACDLLIGVDGGTRHLAALGLIPNLITGDFDSLSLSEREAFARQGVELVPTPDQDYTDLDKALGYVIGARGVEEVRIYAATGGRLDHLYSVLSAVVKYGRKADVRLIDDIGETWLASRSLVLEGNDLTDRTLSLLALGPVTGVTLVGLKWPLTDALLAPGVRDGTLNEIAEGDRVTITHRDGDLLVMLHHARDTGNGRAE